MKRIGLTLRVSENQSYPERRDCIDQRWAKLLLQLNYLPVLLPNLGSTDVEAFLNDSALDGVVLTGGNSLITPDCTPADAAPERDAFEQTLLRWATSREIPVLGICRGMQMINLHFGGNLSNLSNHVGSDHPVTKVDWSTIPAFANLGLQPDSSVVDMDETNQQIEAVKSALVS